MSGTPCLRMQADSAISCWTCRRIWAGVCTNPAAAACAWQAFWADWSWGEFWPIALMALRA